MDYVKFIPVFVPSDAKNGFKRAGIDRWVPRPRLGRQQPVRRSCEAGSARLRTGLGVRLDSATGAGSLTGEGGSKFWARGGEAILVFVPENFLPKEHSEKLPVFGKDLGKGDEARRELSVEPKCEFGEGSANQFKHRDF